MLVVGMVQTGHWMREWNCWRKKATGPAWFQISLDSSFDTNSSHVCIHTHTHTKVCINIYIYKNMCIYMCVCVLHIYVFTYSILVKSHHGLHLLSMKLLFGNNWTPQMWISYLHFMNNIIVLISVTHSGSSPTRFSCLNLPAFTLWHFFRKKCPSGSIFQHGTLSLSQIPLTVLK